MGNELRRYLLASSANSGGGDENYVEIAGIKWAKWNVGATGETDYGYFFQWGDSKGYTAAQVGSGSGKKYFGWSDYKYGNGGSSDSSMIKYNSTDKKTVLEEIDDAAYVASGSTWRMPTDEEYTALGNAVTTAWTSSYEGSGIKGLVCTSKADSSKKIFFPAAGYANNGSYGNRGSYGYYWASNVYSSSVHCGYLALFRSSSPIFSTYGSRCQGFSIRGIYVEPIPLETLTIFGDTSVTNEATYTVNYNPVDTTETGVTWSIVSGSQYATIDSATGALSVLSGASSSAVVVRATSVINPTITADKTISVTYVLNAITFTAKVANSTLGLNRKSSYQTLEYSTNGNTWSSMTTSTYITLPSVGYKVYIRGVLSSHNSTSNYTKFTMSGDIKISGYLNYIWSKNDVNADLKDACGAYMFQDCTGLTDISELVFPQKAPYNCYRYMFQNCTNLVTVADILPATSLGSYCYCGMFNSCSSLVKAPELPAQTLLTYSYAYMFDACSSLNYIKCLATDISASNSTYSWAGNVSPTGTFIKDENMSGWTIGNSGIPTGWVTKTNLFDSAVLYAPFKETQSITDINSGILPSTNTGTITANGYHTDGESCTQCLEYTDSRLLSAFDNDFTFYFELTPYNLNRNQYLFQIQISWYFIGLYIYYTVNNRFALTLTNETWNSNYDQEIPSSPIVEYGKRYRLCFKGGKNSYLYVFINGVKYTIPRSYSSHSELVKFMIARNWGTNRYSKTDFAEFAVWNKNLTDDECIDITSIHLTSLSISGSSEVTNTATYSVEYNPTDTTETGVTWSITNGSSYASIDSNTGVLTALSPARGNSVTIKATSTVNPNIYTTKTVSVNYVVYLTGLTISGETEVTNTANYTFQYNPSNTTQTGVTWSITSGSEYATINANTGVLNALSGASSSTVVIRVTSNVNSSIYAEKTLSVTNTRISVPYTQCTDGTSYLIVPYSNKDFRYKVKLSYNDKISSNYQNKIMDVQGASVGARWFDSYESWYNKLKGVYYSTSTLESHVSTSIFPSVELGKIYEVELSYIDNVITCYIDGVYKYSYSDTRYLTDRGVYFFNDVTYACGSKANIYEAQVYSGATDDTIVYNFVPYEDPSTHYGGFKDTISNNTWTTSGLEYGERLI